MVRAPGEKDESGEWKHIRLEPGKKFPGKSEETARQHAELLKTCNGVKAIVLHITGKTGEHPHLHIWWVSDISGGITNEGLRKRLRSFNDVFATYSGNAMWRIKNHNDYQNWAHYVTRNTSHQVLLGDEKLLGLSVLQKQMVKPEPYTPLPTDKVIRKKPTSREKLLSYCTSELGWEVGNQFHLAHGQNHIYKLARDAAADYANGNLYHNQWIALTRTIIYTYGDDDVKDLIRSAGPTESQIFSL